MGREIARVLDSRGHTVSAIVDPAAPEVPGIAVHETLSAKALRGCDVAIEFSLPDAVLANARVYAETGTCAVIGTTGWLDQLRELESIMEGSPAGVVYGSNFSVGAHVFLAAAHYAASLVRNVEEYDLAIEEMHHRRKQDSPSGTALLLAETVMSAVQRKTSIVTERLDRAPAPEELHVSSTRCGSVPGTHTLFMDSEADTIEITHRARSRGGFALGAVLAAEWVTGREGIHPVESFIKDLLRLQPGG
jgi:4-hydroxy-tetrahydrodipicolinate reductase